MKIAGTAVLVAGANRGIGRALVEEMFEDGRGSAALGAANWLRFAAAPTCFFETYWTTMRVVEAMDNNYRLLDFTVYGRQEMWEDSPTGWPQQWERKQRMRTDGRPKSQWSRLKAGHSDDLGTGSR